MLTTRRTAGIALALFVAAGMLIPDAGANGADTEIRLAVTADCTGEVDRCLEVLEGALEEIQHGHGIRVVLENRASEDHSLHVALLEDADPQRERTSEDASFASMDPVTPGEEGVLAFAPPTYADGVYMWDVLEGQEARGVWIAVPFEGEPATAHEQEEVPLAGALAIATVGAVAASRRRGGPVSREAPSKDAREPSSGEEA